MSRHQEEKRGAVRIPFTHPVTYKATGRLGRQPDEDVSRGEMMDVSHGGMQIWTERALDEGDIVQAWIPVSDPQVTIPVLTQVRWVKEERPGAFQAGLRFLFR